MFSTFSHCLPLSSQVDDDKLLLTIAGGTGCLGISLTKADGTDVESELCPSVKSTNLSIELARENSKLVVTFDGKTHTGSDFGVFKRLIIGGCPWASTEEACIQPSRVYYSDFAGTVRSVHIGGEQKTAQQLIVGGAKVGDIDCDVDINPCGAYSTCSVQGGSVTCTCNDAGATGFYCDVYSAVSFNGYHSIYKTETVAPVKSGNQLLELTVQTNDKEAGDVAHVVLEGGGEKCELNLLIEEG